MVAVPGILEQNAFVRVAWVGAADLGKNVLIPVVSEVAERDAVALLQNAKSSRSGYVLKRLPRVVAKHLVRQQ